MSEDVYILGAGFSKGLGYPLTWDILDFVWETIEERDRKQLTKIIKFHNNNFEYNHPFTHPNIEALLTQLDSNIELFDFTRNEEGNFTKEVLLKSKDKLLVAMADKFYRQQEEVSRKQHPWLFTFFEKIEKDKSVIISFNYDLAIESCSDSERNFSSIYGLESDDNAWKILKPHGSLNWFQQGKKDSRPRGAGKLNQKKVERLLPDDDVYVFKPFRPPTSNKNKYYVPHLIPPTFIKRFGGEVYKQTFRKCVDALSSAKKVYFVGCALPEADFHSKFMIRCGLYNQVHGMPEHRHKVKPSGAAEVIVVNPDEQAARNTSTLILPEHKFRFEKKSTESWINEAFFS